MKSLLILLAAALAPLIALAQGGPVVAPGASATPSTGAPTSLFPDEVTPAPSGPTHDAAATVPLPGQPTSAPLEKNIPLIPETAPATTKGHHKGHAGHAGASPSVFSTFQTEQDIRVRVRLRQAETQALADPAIRAQWSAAENAPTDPERRTLLTAYYNHLYDRMLRLDPENADRINARRLGSISRLKYVRIGNPDDDDAQETYTSHPAAHDFGPNPPTPDGFVPNQ
jgi:hypothetical protein